MQQQTSTLTKDLSLHSPCASASRIFREEPVTEHENSPCYISNELYKRTLSRRKVPQFPRTTRDPQQTCIFHFRRHHHQLVIPQHLWISHLLLARDHSHPPAHTHHGRDAHPSPRARVKKNISPAPSSSQTRNSSQMSSMSKTAHLPPLLTPTQADHQLHPRCYARWLSRMGR